MWDATSQLLFALPVRFVWRACKHQSVTKGQGSDKNDRKGSGKKLGGDATKGKSQDSEPGGM